MASSAPAALTVTTTLEPRGPAGAVVLSDDQVAGFDAGKTFPVRVTIGDTTIDGRIARMGGENLLGFSRATRAALGVEIGDTVTVTIALAQGPAAVEIPDDLAAAFDGEPLLRKAFDALSPSRRREHARSVADAKKPETRTKRIEAVLDALR